MKKEDCCEIDVLNLIKENKGMLWKSVRSIKSSTAYMGRADIYQDFVVVLLECIQSFDPSRNAKFSTHLFWQLRGKRIKIIKKIVPEFKYEGKLRTEMKRRAKRKIRTISIYEIMAGFKPINAKRRKK